MQADIKLIVTDLDGTLIGRANEYPLYASFKAKLDEFRAANRTLWAACTGRNRRSFNNFFYPMRAMGILPDFVIIRHAYILKRTSFGYVSLPFWNLHIRHLIVRQQFYAREALRHWREMITGAAMDVRLAVLKRDELRLQFDSDQSAVMAGQLLNRKLRSFSYLRVFTYMREVEVRPVPFTKGLAVSELARHLDIGPQNVLAIGNGHNDISMFESDVAAYTGCPANSESDVMSVIHRCGGHIARERSLTGVMEILRAYAEGQVNSELPATWVPNEKSRNPRHGGRLADKYHRNHRQIRAASFWMVTGILYVTILVLAYFEQIPLSGPILKPYRLLTDLLMKGMDMLYSSGR